KFFPGSKKLQQEVLRRADDAAPRVRFQAALTIGEFKTVEAAASALQKILLQDYSDRWTRLAAFSSLPEGEEKLLVFLLGKPNFRVEWTSSKLEFMGELADLVGARAEIHSGRSLSGVLVAITRTPADEKVQLAILRGLHAGLARLAGKPPLDDHAKVALK